MAVSIAYSRSISLKRSFKDDILSVMKSAISVTIEGKRIKDVPSSEVESIYRSNRKRHVRIEYTGPVKTNCIGCGIPFLFTDGGRGRYPEYHSNACKQKAYRQRKKTIGV
jgi:hypothetical protein